MHDRARPCTALNHRQTKQEQLREGDGQKRWRSTTDLITLLSVLARLNKLLAYI